MSMSLAPTATRTGACPVPPDDVHHHDAAGARRDCLWIEYGDADAPRRVLIDAGTSPTWREALRDRLGDLGPRIDIELLVVTHVDTDHIGGVLPLFEAAPAGTWFKESGSTAGATRSRDARPHGSDRWRSRPSRSCRPESAGTGGSGRTTAPPGHRGPGVMRAIELDGGLRLTVVAPGRGELDLLRPKWEEVVRDGGLVPGVPGQALVDKAAGKGIAIDLLGDPIPDWAAFDPSDLDTTEANGSSIAVLAEYDDAGTTKRALLAGDAHGPVLARGLRRLAAQRGEARLSVDAFKAPHHGSRKNLTRATSFGPSTPGCGCSRRTATCTAIRTGKRSRGSSSTERDRRAAVQLPDETERRMDDPGLKDRYEYTTEYGDGSLAVAL